MKKIIKTVSLKNTLGILMFFFLTISFSSVTEAKLQYYGEKRSGFWGGVWDGITSPITAPLSVFFDGVNVYNKNNSGLSYNIGFFIFSLLLIKLTIPFYILAWLIKIVGIIILLIIALFISIFR